MQSMAAAADGVAARSAALGGLAGTGSAATASVGGQSGQRSAMKSHAGSGTPALTIFEKNQLLNLRPDLPHT